MSTSEKVTFVGSSGDPLAGRLEVPANGSPVAVALFAHCFTCSKETVAAARIARRLTEHGIAVLRFDFTGLGQSGGDFANTNFSSNIDDLVLAADHLRDTVAAPNLLVGHSLGGAAVLAATERIPEVSAVATIGAPADPAHVVKLLTDANGELDTAGVATVQLGGRAFRIRKQFLADIAAQPQRDRIATLDRALLVMHAPRDEIVGIDNARQIFDAAHHPKSFVSLDDANHFLTRPADAEYVAAVLAAWASRYLPSPTLAQPVAESEPRVVTVADTGEGPFAQRITVGPHTLAADEPAPVGGDTGPTPYDLLLAALGACTSMTLQMYAQRKQLPLRRVTVTLNHRKIHAEDCTTCETQSGRLDHIRRELVLEGDLDASQRAKLAEIADKCPVHRTLQSEVVIETTTRPT